MLAILLFLFFPCAIVGAFVTADEHDTTAVTAFQTASGFFSLEPLTGALQGKSSTVIENASPSNRRSASSCPGDSRREDRAPTVSMLISPSNSLPTTTAKFRESDQDSSPTRVSSYSSDIIWPDDGISSCSSGGSLSDLPRRRRTRPPASSPYPATTTAASNTALRAMSIPARCELPSVDLLREAYGRRRNFWGDLTAAETRRFYHELLPVSIRLAAIATVPFDSRGRPLKEESDVGGLAAVVDAFAEEWESVFGAAETLEEKARLASMSRHAAKLYVRERCRLPVRVVTHLYDGLRHLKSHGSFRVTGMTFEELWEKYEKQIQTEDPSLEGEDLKTRVCLRIIEKSCSTCHVLNTISGCSDLNDGNEGNDGSGESANCAAPSFSPPDQPCGGAVSVASMHRSRRKAVVNSYGVEASRASSSLVNALAAEKGEAQDKKRPRRRERRAFGRSRLFGRRPCSHDSVARRSGKEI